jgi:hypothetical protein
MLRYSQVYIFDDTSKQKTDDATKSGVAIHFPPKTGKLDHAKTPTK